MKKMFIGGLCATMSALLAFGQQNTQTNNWDSLKTACEQLLVKPLDPDALIELSQYASSTSGIPQLKSRAMAVCALAALAKGDTNLFLRASNSHAAKFPQDSDLIQVGIQNCFLPCKACSGKKTIETPVNCTLCSGSGKCVRSDCDHGKWIITQPSHGGSKRETSTLPCSGCKGTGKCPECNGVSILRKKCETCQGDGVLFKRPALLLDNYKQVLREMLVHIQQGDSLQLSIQRAKAEKDLRSRMRAFQSILADLKRCPERDEIEQLLCEDRKTLQVQEEKERRTKELHDAEIATLRKLAESDNPKAAIQAIQDYLKKKPDVPDRLELETLLGASAVKLEKQRTQEKLLYFVGGLLIVLFGLSCIHINIFKNTFLPSYSSTKVTQRRKGADSLTDPLSLSAKDSKARIKTKTAEVAPLED